jgi:recombination protein RecA
MFGNPETTTGGLALKFYASVRIDLRRTENIKQGEEVIGSHIKAWVKKNKVAPPFRQAEFDILYNEGISREGDLLDTGTAMGIIEKRGTYYSYGDTRLGQGRESVKAFLKSNPEITQEIERRIREQAGLFGRVVASPKADTEEEED